LASPSADIRFDPASGQLSTGSFTDYAMPRADTLSPLGVRHLEMPATPERVWRAIQRARE